MILYFLVSIRKKANYSISIPPSSALNDTKIAPSYRRYSCPLQQTLFFSNQRSMLSLKKRYTPTTKVHKSQPSTITYSPIYYQAPDLLYIYILLLQFKFYTTLRKSSRFSQSLLIAVNFTLSTTLVLFSSDLILFLAHTLFLFLSWPNRVPSISPHASPVLTRRDRS